MSVNYYRSPPGARSASSGVLKPRDIEAWPPGADLVSGATVFLTQAAEDMDLSAGGIRILSPAPGSGSCVVSLLAAGQRMTRGPIDLTGRRVRAVPPEALLPGCRRLPANTRLDLRVDSMTGLVPWRGLRVVFLPTGRDGES